MVRQNKLYLLSKGASCSIDEKNVEFKIEQHRNTFNR